MNRNIIAILRSITPPEASDIGQVLVEAGITKIEVPLNSPQPFESIAQLVNSCGTQAVIGAGTVLTVGDVERVHDVGGRLIVSPDCYPKVIERTKTLGMLSYPGVMTPTECFAALRAGADGLKLFPAAVIGPAGLAAMRAVLPSKTEVLAVGGAGPDNFNDWVSAGASGFGLGTAIYRAGDTANDVAQKAKSIVVAYDQVFAE